MKMSASRTALAIALVGGAAALAGCNPPDLTSYDPHAKFAADVQKKTAVMFLNSDAASYVNGHVMEVDGGFMGALATGQIDLSAMMGGMAKQDA